MTKRGVRILCGTTVRVVQCTQDTFTAKLSDDSSVEVDKVMFALGRWPNVAGLGLEAAGVRFSDRHGIAVDPLSQTSVPQDRKSTRLNSSHPSISYAVFCLKKKT